MVTERVAPSLPTVAVAVVYSARARHWTERALVLPAGSTVSVAVRQSGMLQGLPADLVDGLTVALWGKPVSLDRVLRDGDRVELLRGLKVDPTVARRERFVRQGAKAAGLFAKQRPGGKAGY